jgi:hypothetical protein
LERGKNWNRRPDDQRDCFQDPIGASSLLPVPSLRLPVPLDVREIVPPASEFIGSLRNRRLPRLARAAVSRANAAASFALATPSRHTVTRLLVSLLFAKHRAGFPRILMNAGVECTHGCRVLRTIRWRSLISHVTPVLSRWVSKSDPMQPLEMRGYARATRMPDHERDGERGSGSYVRGLLVDDVVHCIHWVRPPVSRKVAVRVASAACWSAEC